MRSRDLQALAALTVAGAVLRFATIDVQSFWFDEALTARLLRMPFGDMLGDLPDTELTPPLYYVLAWPWAELFGTSELALRSYSALAGIATIPVAWMVARQLASRRIAVIAAALAAFNPLLVWYSQETRPYALFVLLGSLSFLFFVRALDAGRRRDLALWALFSALAVLTHYFAAFIVVPEGLWLLYRLGPKREVLVAGGVVAAVGLALAPLAAHQADRISTGYITSVSFVRRVLGVPEDFLTGFVIGFNTPVENVLAVVAGALAVLGLFLAVARTSGSEWRGVLLAAGIGVAAVGLPVLVAIVGPDYVNTRNLIVAWLPLMLVLAIGYGARRTGRRLGIAATALLCAVGVATTLAIAADETLHRSNWRDAADALGDPDGPRVLAVPPLAGDVSLELYLDDLSTLPPRGATVREIDLLTVRSSRFDVDRSVRGAPPPQPPAPGFELVDARFEETYIVLRYRSERPRHVTPAQLAPAVSQLIPAASLLIQQPG